MADTVKYRNQLKIVMGFTDGDERTLSLENPKANITAEEIRALEPLLQGVVIGDKYGAPFSVIRDAGIQQSTTVYLDLE